MDNKKISSFKKVMKTGNSYNRLYDIVRRIPAGKVATYGQIAEMAGGYSPRQAGYAMAAVPADSGIPWHRVINSQGRISIRSHGEECWDQRELLEQEGVHFSESGKVDLKRFGWIGD